MDSQKQKIVTLAYIAASVLLGYIVFSFLENITGIYDLETRVRNVDLYIRIGSAVVGVLLFLVLFKHAKANEFMNEVVTELARVTWPTQKDTSRATIVVIVMVIISGLILGGLDALWTWLLNQVL